MSNFLRMHFNLLISILVVQLSLSVAEPIEHTIGGSVFKDIGRLALSEIIPLSALGFSMVNNVSYVFCSLEKVFRKSDLFQKVSNEPKNYTIRYKYSKKDVGGGISYTQFNILGAEVNFHHFTKPFV